MISRIIRSSFFIFLFILLVFIGCGTNTGNEDTNNELDNIDSRAEEIVQNSIEAHGGLERWTRVKSISYSKNIALYDSTGAQESEITQYHSYQLKPALSGVIWWLSESDTVIIAFANGEGVKSINSVQEQSLESKIAATKSFLSSYYVLFQPFKLKDSGTGLVFIGDGMLEDGTEVNIIQPMHAGAKPGDDKWWYYFDKKTNNLVATMVYHPPTFSLINNLVYDKSTEILFNSRRKSYFVDSQRNVQYLRAEYFYENYRLEFLD